MRLPRFEYFRVPAVIIFHKIDSLAGNGMRDDRRRLRVDRVRLIQGAEHLAHVMPVDLDDMPAEGSPLVREGLEGHHVRRGARLLDPVAVDDRDEVAEPVLGLSPGRLRGPCRPSRPQPSGVPP